MNRRHKACRAPRLQPATPPPPPPLPMPLPPPLTSPPFPTRLRHPAPSPDHPSNRPPIHPSTPLLSLPPTSPALFYLPTNPTSNVPHHRSVICGLSNSLRGLLLPETLPLSFSPSPCTRLFSTLPLTSPIGLLSLPFHLSISLSEAPVPLVYPQLR